ncbi:MAG: hypothetical protein HQ463_10010 [Bacteroidetes bacterium]|nr:hypothetical protein [Bacteroidota bacterium]
MMLEEKIQKFLPIFNAIVTKLFKGKYTYLVWLAIPFLMIIALSFLSKTFGDSNRMITGKGEIIILDVLFILLYTIPLALYYKFKNFKFKLSFSNIILLSPIAFFFRLWLASLGGNYDLESYNIVADIILDGRSVYGNTYRYNYGPVWAYILAGCKFVALNFNDSGKVFHYLIVCILFIAEFYIGYQLSKKYKNPLLFLLFIFNPIGIIIAGYHSQFDILAIAVALASSIQLSKNNILKAAILLGLSLMIKHIMVFYAFYIIFDKSISLKNKAIFTFLPVGIFLISFVPFLKDLEAIKENVFGYKFGFNAGIYSQILHFIFPERILNTALFKWLPVFKDWMFLWFFTMVTLGYLTNKYIKKYTFEMYSLVLVFTSVSFSEQYLYIPVLALVVFYKYYAAWVYTFLATFFLMFYSINNLAHQGWLKLFCVDVPREKLYISYPNMQIWLLVIIIILFKKFYTKEDINKGIQ